MRILVAVLLASCCGVLAQAEAAPAHGAEVGPVTLTGRMLSDFSFRQNVDEGSGKTSPASGVGLDLKRFYVGAAWHPTGWLSTQFLTDIGDEGHQYDVFVKNAYVEAKIAPAFILRAGAAANPWIPYAEGAYGHRYVENTLIDRTHFGFAADWGLHLLGSLANGRFGYQLSVVNGRGFTDPTRAQAPSVEARINGVLFGGLRLALGGAYTTFGRNLVGAAPLKPATRLDALAAWVSPVVRVGAEAFVAHDDTPAEVTGIAPEDTSRGLGVFASVPFAGRYGVFARFDGVQPRLDTQPGLLDTYFDGGVEVSVSSHLRLAFVAKHEVVSAGTEGNAGVVTSNGTIGSTAPGGTGRYDELGLFSQVDY